MALGFPWPICLGAGSIPFSALLVTVVQDSTVLTEADSGTWALALPPAGCGHQGPSRPRRQPLLIARWAVIARARRPPTQPGAPACVGTPFLQSSQLSHA